MKFSYTGKKGGRTVKGTIDAPDRKGASNKLRAQGVSVNNLTKASALSGDLKLFGGKAKIKPMMLMMMTRQLATLLKAGVPILTSVHSLVTQTEDEALQKVLHNVELGIQNGLSLSKSLATQKGIFSDLYVNIVFAGESGGALPEILTRLADLIERDNKIAAEVKSAFRYPFIVLGALVCAFIFLVNFVVPKFTAMFKQFRLELPLPTRVLITISELMGAYWGWMILITVSLIFAFVKFKKTDTGKRLIDIIFLKLPVMGTLTIKFSMARFASLLSTLIKSGVPIVSCLKIVKNTIENSMIKKDIEIMIKRVESGEGIYTTMKESPYFPTLMANMVEIGEKSGSIDEMLNMISDHYEMETHYAVKALTSMIEPVMTICAGSMILGVALAIFVPMWDIVKAARQ
ncbi:MAG: type II secretion system F family protein [Candidatus Aureabacteria bacterium]|nr:type II secretion system F family protein [Candidatus Auribacterota bacterium]